MGCGNKIKETCGDTMYATCVDYEGNLGNNTKITESCVTIEETTEDLYLITDEIIEGLDTSNLGNLCLTYETTGGTILPKTVLEVHESKLCELDQKIIDLNDLENLDISEWNVDFGCLEDACNNPVLTLGGFAQAVQQAICDGIIPPTQETQPRVVSGEIVDTNLILTRDDLTTFSVDVTSLLDNIDTDTNLSRIVSGAIVDTDLILTRDDATTLVIDVTNIGNTGSTGDGNDFITGANLNGTTLNITGTGTSGASVDLSPLQGSGTGSGTVQNSYSLNLALSGGSNAVTSLPATATVTFEQFENFVTFNGSFLPEWTPSVSGGNTGTIILTGLTDTPADFTPFYTQAFGNVGANFRFISFARTDGSLLIQVRHDSLNLGGLSDASKTIYFSGIYKI